PPDGRRHAIQPADVRGRFQLARRAAFGALMALWAALPWIRIGGHPCVFIDIGARHFFLFGTTFNAQDTWLLFFLLTGVGFGLFYVTALAGRVWCGWACPQTVFLEGVFRPIERWIEGPREARMRRNRRSWNFEKAARKITTHAFYVLAALVVAHVVLSYFVSLPKALQMVRHAPSAHPQAFAWVVATTSALYLNFAWFREQLCVVLCPYGRLQSALMDEHSLVVGYDARRGEPRGKRGTAGAGDCVDCKRCIVVCPTGIDIRSGLQMECVACTACIDACDEVMVKLGRAPGLVRYDSQNGLSGKPRRVVRPRIFLYTVLLVVGTAVALTASRRRSDFEAHLMRLPGEPYTLDGDQVRNALQLHIVNKRATEEAYRVDVGAVDGMSVVVPIPSVTVASLSDARVPIFLSMSRDRSACSVPVHVRVARSASGEDSKQVTGSFLGPCR
ncbi:MAG TPA: cytochrome c oxidase accessory protein CcoG, partial [Polyangiaceae bacterium]|nr:cytochrome c oxidase accessory protein CcoG [Polyangiaceae bacterium]